LVPESSKLDYDTGRLKPVIQKMQFTRLDMKPKDMVIYGLKFSAMNKAIRNVNSLLPPGKILILYAR